MLGPGFQNVRPGFPNGRPGFPIEKHGFLNGGPGFHKEGSGFKCFFLLEQYFREDLLSKTWARSPFQETWSSFWENRSPLQKIGFPILETGNRVSHSGHSVPFFINKTAVIYKNQAPLSPKKNKKQVPYSLNQVSY